MHVGSHSAAWSCLRLWRLFLLRLRHRSRLPDATLYFLADLATLRVAALLAVRTEALRFARHAMRRRWNVVRDPVAGSRARGSCTTGHAPAASTLLIHPSAFACSRSRSRRRNESANPLPEFLRRSTHGLRRGDDVVLVQRNVGGRRRCGTQQCVSGCTLSDAQVPDAQTIRIRVVETSIPRLAAA